MERLNKYIDSLKEEVKQCLVDCGGCCILISNDGKCECENANKICFFEQLKSYKEAEEQGLLLMFPVAVGDTVYVICECENIPQRLDGTLYESDGSPGTATGYYCPYEDECPHECMECDELFDCDKFKQKQAVFEDMVQAIMVDEYGFHVVTENCPVCGDLGKDVFRTKEEAEAALEKKMKGE